MPTVRVADERELPERGAWLLVEEPRDKRLDVFHVGGIVEINLEHENVEDGGIDASGEDIEFGSRVVAD